MTQVARGLIVVLLCLSAVACGGKKVKPSGPNATDPSATPAERGGQAGAYAPGDLEADACLRERVVYFDFDQDALRPESRPVVDCHAKYLRDRPSARVVLSAHADERGTRGYNVGLSERRGNAVSSALAVSGASATQINVVSYGEERPTCVDSSEDCWARNRRVEIDYEAR
jgi:peptidoglycan-associated lipoprotein